MPKPSTCFCTLFPGRRHVSNSRLRRGNVIVLSAILMVVVCAFAALAIDAGIICLARTELQLAADSAALAAAGSLIDAEGKNRERTAAETAIHFGGLNGAVGQDGVELDEEGIRIGRYDPDTGTVQPDARNPNAVEVVARRLAARGNAVNLFFAPVLGHQYADVSARAVALLPAVPNVPVLPIALRTPDFGEVDPDLSARSPGKDGPSYPTNGEYFEQGEQVTVFVFGQGPMPAVHLALEYAPAPSGDLALLRGQMEEIFVGGQPYPPIQIGNDYTVHNEGTGNVSFGRALASRLAAPVDDPLRKVVLPVVQIIEGSRDASGDLAGQVRVVDFVAVHLDAIIHVDVTSESEAAIGGTLTREYLVGTVIRRVASRSGSGAEPSGVGNNSVVSAPRLVQ